MTEKSNKIEAKLKPHQHKGLMAKLRAFKDDERGINLVEFAFAAPFLLVLMAGSSTVMELENASSTVGKVTATISDILSQSPAVDNFAVSNAFKAADFLVPKSSNFQAYVAGIQITAAGSTVVLWATQNQKEVSLNVPVAGDVYDKLPEGLKDNEGFVVVTRGRMDYAPTFGGDYLKSANGVANFEYANFFVPRVSVETLCNACEQVFPE